METLNKKRLGDILVSSGKITYEQLNEALISQKILGKKLGEILLDSNIITEKDMMEAIKEQTGIKEVDLNYSNEEIIKAAEELSKEALESKVIVKDDDIDDIKNAPVVKMI